MINEKRLIEYEYLIKSLSDSGNNNDLDRLCDLVEHVRAEGILYQDFHKENAILIEILLKNCINLLKETIIDKTNRSWWFISEVYDIIFHQVRLKEYPPICTTLYFELSKEVLESKFHRFWRDNDIPSYRKCVYFIQMAYQWFANRNEEFLVLYKNMKPLISEKIDDLEDPWINKQT